MALGCGPGRHDADHQYLHGRWAVHRELDMTESSENEFVLASGTLRARDGLPANVATIETFEDQRQLGGRTVIARCESKGGTCGCPQEDSSAMGLMSGQKYEHMAARAPSGCYAAYGRSMARFPNPQDHPQVADILLDDGGHSTVMPKNFSIFHHLAGRFFRLPALAIL